MTRETESRQQQQQEQEPQAPAQDENAHPFRHFLRDIDIAAAVARRNLPQQQQAAELDYHINEDGIIEGGVAVSVPASVEHYLSDEHANGGGLRRSTECDLVLFLECSEDLQTLPNSIAKRGTTISIGLEKTTKLSAVFNRFVEFVTEKSRDKEPLSITDLEFVHNEILSGKDTAEGSALMKDDRIKVRRQRQHLREEKREREIMQKKSDHYYFKHLRSLLTDASSPGGNFDVVFDCVGELPSEHEQCNLVKAHASVIQRRCGWLGDIIRKAREEKKQKSLCKIATDDEDDAVKPDIVPRMVSQTHTIEKDSTTTSKVGDIADDVMQVESTSQGPTDVSPSNRHAISDFVGDGTSFDAVECVDDDDAVRPCQLNRENTEQISSGAAEVVAVDDDLSVEDSGVVACRDRSLDSPFRRMQSHSSQANVGANTNMLWVTLKDHHPKAVRLLLEYCYTNRCVPLGEEAFFQSSKGAVCPSFTNYGIPTISLPLALAAIRLAEDACMPRFSLMCEIAASNLVSKSTVLEALSLCSTQEVKSGNRLPILRKSAISLLLQRPVLNEVVETNRFINTLKKESEAVVPSLLLGAKDIIPKTSKRKRSSSNQDYLKRIDADDRVQRNIERSLNRGKRNSASNFDESFLTELRTSLSEKSKKRSLQGI